MNQILTDLAISLIGSFGIGFVIAMFAKYFPKEQTFNKSIAPSAEFFAVLLHSICVKKLRLKYKQESDIEEGVFKTVAFWLDSWIKVFMAKWNSLIAERYEK